MGFFRKKPKTDCPLSAREEQLLSRINELEDFISGAPERIRQEIGELEHQQRRDHGQHDAIHDREGLPREAIEQFDRLHHEIIELRQQVQQLQELIERRLR